VEYQSVVGVKDVRAIYSKSARKIPDQTQREPCSLAKRVHRHIRGLGFRRELTWMRGAIDRGLMAFGLLLAREVNGETLHTS